MQWFFRKFFVWKLLAVISLSPCVQVSNKSVFQKKKYEGILLMFTYIFENNILTGMRNLTTK